MMNRPSVGPTIPRSSQLTQPAVTASQHRVLGPIAARSDFPSHLQLPFFPGIFVAPRGAYMRGHRPYRALAAHATT
eukprot:1974053-Pleurochrysis_carterae.AAC.1